MEKLKQIMTGAASFLLPLAALAGEGIEVNHLGTDNTLVRVTGEGKYLILPIQENIDDAKINVIVDNEIVKTFYARLAKSKTDYTVPFDLTPYEGKNVELMIETPQGRSSVREAKGDACWKGLSVSDTFDTSNREKYRPAYHHTPLYGWMNDPNGMFYKDGKWHLYYQHNPYGSKWQNMTWGHSVSTDLVNWEHLPLGHRARRARRDIQRKLRHRQGKHSRLWRECRGGYVHFSSKKPDTESGRQQRRRPDIREIFRKSGIAA